uniref:Uncharacterized protein n=1 Tax=Rhipicephalus appendiculatus TaxID=34631 RepID=A0A131YGR1_RHIAP
MAPAASAPGPSGDRVLRPETPRRAGACRAVAARYLVRRRARTCAGSRRREHALPEVSGARAAGQRTAVSGASLSGTRVPALRVPARLRAPGRAASPAAAAATPSPAIGEARLAERQRLRQRLPRGVRAVYGDRREGPARDLRSAGPGCAEPRVRLEPRGVRQLPGTDAQQTGGQRDVTDTGGQGRAGSSPGLRSGRRARSSRARGPTTTSSQRRPFSTPSSRGQPRRPGVANRTTFPAPSADPKNLSPQEGARLITSFERLASRARARVSSETCFST